MVGTIVDLFTPIPRDGVVLDATLGGGGHAAAILAARPDLRLVGLDQDADAIAAATRRLEPFADRVRIFHVRFDQLGDIVHEHCEGGVMGVLFDLGVSSPQLDRPNRGFSFRRPGPLDMRMDQRQQLTAETVVNDTDATELARILRAYGDERYSMRIAQAIEAARPLHTTAELAEVVANAIPAPARRKNTGHPARRTFQALRIHVNDELSILADSIDAAISVLLPGGRAVAMSYHSGEDRLVKGRFRLAASGGCVCPADLPCGCGAVPSVALVTRGAIKADAAEIARNPRAESVRIRAVEKLQPEVATMSTESETPDVVVLHEAS